MCSPRAAEVSVFLECPVEESDDTFGPLAQLQQTTRSPQSSATDLVRDKRRICYLLTPKPSSASPHGDSIDEAL
eukprot:scaffold127140_cov72-Phaeocystis_antarctica.AAC.2